MSMDTLVYPLQGLSNTHYHTLNTLSTHSLSLNTPFQHSPSNIPANTPSHYPSQRSFSPVLPPLPSQPPPLLTTLPLNIPQPPLLALPLNTPLPPLLPPLLLLALALQGLDSLAHLRGGGWLAAASASESGFGMVSEGGFGMVSSEGGFELASEGGFELASEGGFGVGSSGSTDSSGTNRYSNRFTHTAASDCLTSHSQPPSLPRPLSPLPLLPSPLSPFVLPSPLPFLPPPLPSHLSTLCP